MLIVLFSYIALRSYNKLPITIKQIDSVNTFKTHHKAFLFSCTHDQSGLTVQEVYALKIFGIVLIFSFFSFSFFEHL